MSRLIRTTPAYLSLAFPIVTAYPFTWIVWFFPTVAGNRLRLMSEADTAIDLHRFLFLYHPTNVLRVNARDSSSNISFSTTNAATLNVWNMGAFVAASATDRRVILKADFGNEGSDATNISPTGLDNTTFGVDINGAGTFASDINYRTANIAVYNVALSNNELTAINRGTWAKEIRRGNLIANWRLLGNTDPEPDSATPNQSLTLTSAPAKGDHQGMKLWTPPPPSIFISSVPGPSGGAIQKVAFDYRH